MDKRITIVGRENKTPITNIATSIGLKSHHYQNQLLQRSGILCYCEDSNNRVITLVFRKK